MFTLKSPFVSDKDNQFLKEKIDDSISKEVFFKRKQGLLDEAYDIALSAFNDPSYNFTDWDMRAFVWCLIDIVKRESKNNNIEKMNLYSRQLTDIKLNFSDDVLKKQKEQALKLCNPYYNQILKAKVYSKEGKHTEAAKIYRKLLCHKEYDREVTTGLAWELYYISKMAIEQQIANFSLAKRCLNEYLQILSPEPSNLHICFLRIAVKIAQENNLQLGSFVKLWKLENLRAEDFIQSEYQGKSYPSLAEKVIQGASKDITARKDIDAINYIFPFLESAINKYPDNIWLKYYKAKMLIIIGKFEEAVSYGIELVKNKTNEYWSWKFLGDIYLNTDKNIALSCYCKSLLCSDDINFTWKAKFELHNILKLLEDFSRAKCEIEEIERFKYNHQQSIPNEIQNINLQEWFLNANASENNKDFYLKNCVNAEELLYRYLPWIDAIFGEKITINDKCKRLIYVKDSFCATEISVPENSIHLNYKEIVSGKPIKIKAEIQENQRYKVYKIFPRDGQEWDILSDSVGVIDHINHQKYLIHCIINKNVSCTINFKELHEKVQLGEVISFKLVKFYSKKGLGFRAIKPIKTTQIPSENILKHFISSVSENNGMGFTEEGIFIPADLMSKHKIDESDIVSGKAVLSYNKKRSEWGWKAVEIL